LLGETRSLSTSALPIVKDYKYSEPMAKEYNLPFGAERTLDQVFRV
jgi:hypothetical protein